MKRIAKQVIVGVVILVILTVSLRGIVPPKNADQVDLTAFPTGTMTAIDSSSYKYGFEENFSTLQPWSFNSSKTVTGNISLSSATLVASMHFAGGTTFQDFDLLRSLDVNVSAYPLVNLQFISTTKDVTYGVRFLGTDVTGRNVTIKSDTSQFEHQAVTGTPQIVQFNIESYANLEGYNVSRVTGMLFYVEAASTTDTAAGLTMSRLSFFRLEPTVYTSSVMGNFQSVQILIEPPTTNLSIDRIFVSFNLRGSSDLLYIPILSQPAQALRGQQMLSTGLEATGGSVSSFQVVAIQSYQNMSIVPVFYAPSSNLTITLQAIQGSILSFDPTDITIAYSADPSASGVPLSIGGVLPSFAFYILMIIALPSSIFLGLNEWFNEKPSVSRRSLYLVGFTGILIRFLIAPFTGGFDLGQWAYYPRLYYESGIVDLRYYPVLPPVYFLFLLAMGPYYLLRLVGLPDARFFVHSNMMIEGLFIKTPMILADLGIYLLILRFTSKGAYTGKSLVYASAFLFNPFSIFISAAWGQIDSIMLLAVVAGIWLTELSQTLRSAASFAVAGILKLFGFFPLALLALSNVLQRRFGSVLRIMAVSVLVVAATVLPFANWNSLFASLFLRLLGASPASISQESELSGFFPQLSGQLSTVLLIVSLAGVFSYYSWSRSGTKMLRALVLAAISVYLFEVNFGAQWFVWVFPFLILMGERENREGLIRFSFVLGISLFILISVGRQTLGLLITGEPYPFSTYPDIPIQFVAYAYVLLFILLTTTTYLFLLRPSKNDAHTRLWALFALVIVVCSSVVVAIR